MTQSARRILFGLLVALVAVVNSAPTLRNYFAQDDLPFMQEDARIVDPSRWGGYLNEAYWPANMRRDLYRPLTSLVIASEWQVGKGASFPFKTMQITLYAAACIAVLALALRLLPPWAGLTSALLFAVHPAHVEAVALAVGQAEEMVGLLATLAVIYYWDRRRRGDLSTANHAVLALMTLAAAHFKESGVMIPVLLVATEVILFRDIAWRERWRTLTSMFIWQTLAVVVTFALRLRIPFETTSGTFVAEAFDGMSIGSRALTMLSIVPEWLRLMLWPATLSADYSPRTILPATSWGLDQTVGLAILVLIGILAWRLRKRTPLITFGVAWCAIGLFPVSNVLLPTGIPLAERTLFLPSVGVMIAIGAFLNGLIEASPARRSVIAGSTAAVVALVCVLGTLRSRSRHAVWHDNFRMWAQTVIDVPDSYRARMALGTLLMKAGYPDRAIHQYEAATELWDQAWGPYYQLGEWYRHRGDCQSAIRAYSRVLELHDVVPARASLSTCLVWEGRYKEAHEVAMQGVGGKYYAGIFRAWVRTADSAEAIDAPPHTVTFPEGYNYLFIGEIDSALTTLGGAGRSSTSTITAQ